MISNQNFKPFNISEKEIARAETFKDLKYTIVVRPQPDGRYLVVAIDLNTRLPLFDVAIEFAESKDDIHRAVVSINRWIDKSTGCYTNMSSRSRMEHR